ncbi:MAG: gamma-glutamyl-gamma-aminobutyrate hydrolase family protein [Bacteroidales bacterium]|nr:gamma-glutamyl-gamma-aminobutyrate hydrolase family protein [Bacteroidales bacterium]
MEPRPIIGVLPLWDIDRNSLWMLTEYLDGIREAGGTPLILTFDLEDSEIERFAGLCDGLLFTGGQDVHPSVYGEEDRTGKLIPCPKRDALEKKVLEAALKADKAVFGICRGLQLINAALGGTLYQDLPSEHPSSIIHRQAKPYDKPTHTVSLKGDLAALLGKDVLPVNSLHHQAVRDLAPGLVPVATTPDDLTEAFVMPGARFLWAVQWHPEYLFRNDACSRLLFGNFVSQCL